MTALPRLNVKAFDKQLAARMREVAAVRDRLDLMIGDAEQLRDCCDDAYHSLQSARDALSELV